MQPAPVTTSIPVGTIPIHEAGHSVCAIAVGGDAGFVYAGEEGGAALVAGKTPLGEMVILAAGIAATVVVKPFSVEGKQMTSPPPPRDDEFSAPMMAAAFLVNHGEMVKQGGGSDRERFEKMLEKLAEAGRIKTRKYFESRWWWFFRRKAERILEGMRPQVRAVAGALAVRGGLNGQELQEVLAGAGFNVSGPRPAPPPFRTEAAAGRSPGSEGEAQGG